MAFQLDKVVPWGRTFEEYKDMFQLQEKDLAGRIAGFGDGPASFNYELTKRKGNIISFDPIYQFSREQLEKRIEETRSIVIKQTKENMENFIWERIRDLNHLETLRMGAMQIFLNDYEAGLKEGRYIYHELPERINYPDNYFALGLSSHFLLMYVELGEEFHIKAIREMLRVCKEVRIFPVVNLDGKETKLSQVVMKHFKEQYHVELITVAYQFQKNGNRMLRIRDRGFIS